MFVDNEEDTMINFDEELEKFQPSMDVDRVEDAVLHTKYEDVTDIVKDLMKEMMSDPY